MSLGKRIKSTRIEKGIKLYQMAEGVGISQQALNKIEKDLVKRTGHLLAISKILGVSASWLEYGDEFSSKSIIELSKQENELIFDFRLLSKTDQASVLKITGALKARTKVSKNA